MDEQEDQVQDAMLCKSMQFVIELQQLISCLKNNCHLF